LRAFFPSRIISYLSKSAKQIVHFSLTVLYTVEFQKCGLPHAHIIFWVSTDTSESNPEFIDSVITVEIPDPGTNPLGYVLVAEHMVYGPCGNYNKNAPCMKDGKCSKNYPKKFQEETSIDENGFILYRLRNNGRFIIKGNARLDNRWIVPTNLLLLKQYGAHINVEWCNKSIFIKYLFKYVTKGPDRSKGFLKKVQENEDVPYDNETNCRDEVQEYLDSRYICDKDSCWCIYGYEIQMHVHLLNEKYITYQAKANMAEILSESFLQKTMLTKWFVTNANNPHA
jgi:hypothetical protein